MTDPAALAHWAATAVVALAGGVVSAATAAVAELLRHLR